MEPKTKAEKVLMVSISILFFGIMYITYRSSDMLPKIATMAMIPIALLTFLIRPDFELVKELSPLPIMMLLQFVGIAMISFTIWIIHLETSNYMVPGVTKIVYQCVNIIVAFCVVYMLRNRAIEFAFLGAAAFNMSIAIGSAVSSGIGAIIPDIINTVLSGDQVGFMRRLELNELTYSMGFFAIYYTIYGGNISPKKRIIYAIMANTFFFLGYKRIGILSIVAAYVIYLLFRIMPKKTVKSLCVIIGGILSVICILYVPFIRYNIFQQVADEYNINLNARDGLYSIVDVLYDFSPSYLGRGFGYIQEYLDYLKTLHVTYHGSSAHFIHNDILVFFIELGFWGFLAWLFYNCIFMQRYYNNKYGVPIATLYCVSNFYYYLSLFTDNMATHYSVTITFRIIMLSVAADYIMKIAPDQIDLKTMIIHRRETAAKRREKKRKEWYKKNFKSMKNKKWS